MAARRRPLRQARWSEACREFGTTRFCLACDSILKEDLPPTDVLDALDRKPVYLRPWVAAAARVLIAGCFVAAIHEYFRPPDISLAILPVRGAGDLQHKPAKAFCMMWRSGLPRSQTANQNFADPTVQQPHRRAWPRPEQAERVLHATHVLQLELHRDGNGSR